MSTRVVTPFNQKIRLNVLKVGGLLLLPILFVAAPHFNEDGIAMEMFEVIGMFLMITCVIGRLWSTLYIGSRKNETVVTEGPYSITRNPLYFFSTVGTLGIGLMFGMMTLAAALTLVVGGILYLTALREQAFLESEFGPAYREYAERVPMFFPDPRLFYTSPIIEVAPAVLKRNLRDAVIFLLAFPLLEFIEILRERFDIVLFALY